MEKVIIKNRDLGEILACIQNINAAEKNPFGWNMAHNEKKISKKSEDLGVLLQDISAKYCKKSIVIKGIKYQLKKELQEKVLEAKTEKAKKLMISMLDLKDFDAGKKQDEYESKIKEALDATVEVELRSFSMAEKIQVGEDETISLNDVIRRNGIIKPQWLAPLMDIILTD